MSQVFVPSVGLNLQQGQAQQGARVDTGLTRQIDPTENLKPLNHLFDTVSKDLGRWDQMNVQRDALERFDNLQQQLTANRDEFFSKKGQDAIDFAKTYEKNNKETFAKAMDDVDDFRVRNALHENAKRMYDGYVTNGNSYLTEQTAVANLNQAKASLTQAANNYIDQYVNGNQQQQADSEAQFNAAIDAHSLLTGINPKGIDGEEERKRNHDAIYKSMTQHYIAHQAYAAGNQALDAAKSKMTYQTWLEEKDKLYLSQQAQAESNRATAHGFKLQDRSSWVLARATDMVNSDEAELKKDHPEVLQNNPTWRETRMQGAIALAGQEYDEMATKVKALSDTDVALGNVVSTAYNQANATHRTYSIDGQAGGAISDEVLADPNNVLGRLDPNLQKILYDKYGSVEKANSEMLKRIQPTMAVSSGNAVQLVMEAQQNPDLFYSRYANRTQLSAELFRNGVGYDDRKNILNAYDNKQAQQEESAISNTTKYVIEKCGDDELNDKKKLVDPILAQKQAKYAAYCRQKFREYKKANPSLTDEEIQSRIGGSAKIDHVLQDELKKVDAIKEQTDTFAEFQEDLQEYSEELRKAVQAFNGSALENCFTGDYATGATKLRKLISSTLENKNFQNAYPYLPEVQAVVRTEKAKENSMNEIGEVFSENGF